MDAESAAGYEADPALLAEVFAAEADGGVESLVYRLLEALGFRLGGDVGLVEGDWVSAGDRQLYD